MATPFGQSGSYTDDSRGTMFGQAGSRSAARAKKTPFGQEGSSAARKLGTPFGQTSRSTKPRSKSSDVSRMNPLYKPKASPGPATLNVYGAPKPQTLNLYGASTGTYQTKKVYGTPTAGYAKPKGSNKNTSSKKNVAGFKAGSVGAKAIGAIKGIKKDLKKAYQGK